MSASSRNAHGRGDGSCVVTRRFGLYLWRARQENHLLGVYLRPFIIILYCRSTILNMSRIALQDADGKQRDTWSRTPIRVTDLAITPDFTRLVAVGMYDQLVAPTEDGQAAAPVEVNPHSGSSTRIIIYQLSNKQEQA